MTRKLSLPKLDPTPHDFVVRASETNPANVEIAFSSRPNALVRAALRKAKFRFSHRLCCWYGKAENLPNEYREG